MESGQKAIMIAVGIFVTLLIISIVLIVTNMGLELANTGTERIAGISGMIKTELFKSQFGERNVRYDKIQEAFNEYADKLFICVEDNTINNYVYTSNTMNNANSSSTDLYFFPFNNGEYYYIGTADGAVYAANTDTPRKFMIKSNSQSGYYYTANPLAYSGASSYTRYFLYKKNDSSTQIIGLFFRPTGKM